MSENVIFCYSGSGNCLDIAKNIAKELGDTDIIMMRKAPVKTDVTDAKTVGFVFSCCAGGFPADVEKYLPQIKINASSYRWGVTSFAGYPGIGMAKIHELFKLDYWTGISHQSACIWLMPHTLQVPPVGAEKAQTRSEEMAKYVAANIKVRRHLEGSPFAPAANKLESKAWPILAARKAAAMTVSDACVGCGQCAKLCPRENITLVNGKAMIGKNCIGCLSCLQYCPQQAISLGGVTVKRERWHNPNVSAAELMQGIIHID